MALASVPVKLKVNTLEALEEVSETSYTEHSLVLDVSSLPAGLHECTVEMLNDESHSAFNIKELIVEAE